MNKLNWHPLASHPLDYLDSDRLRTPEGDKVTIIQGMTGVSFTVRVEGKAKHTCGSILGVCNVLDNLEVGTI